jgi:hypothetical protein
MTHDASSTLGSSQRTRLGGVIHCMIEVTRVAIGCVGFQVVLHGPARDTHAHVLHGVCVRLHECCIYKRIQGPLTRLSSKGLSLLGGPASFVAFENAMFVCFLSFATVSNSCQTFSGMTCDRDTYTHTSQNNKILSSRTHTYTRTTSHTRKSQRKRGCVYSPPLKHPLRFQSSLQQRLPR